MKIFLSSSLVVLSTISFGQTKFAQLDIELPTPNEFRTAAGAPGNHYYQQKADYKIDLVLDDIYQ
jgi:hypothetical protein